MIMYRVAVVAHVNRFERAVKLAAQLGAAVFVDDGSQGEWNNHARAWQYLAGQQADWGVVLQDDAVVTDSFHEDLASLLDHVPSRSCVGLYAGTSYPGFIQQRLKHAIDAAVRYGAGWLESDTLFWGVGVAMPLEHVLPALALPSALPYDQRLGNYFRHKGLPVYYPARSLVDHEDGPSLVEHADGLPRVLPRRAHRFGPPTARNTRTVEF